MSIFNRKMKNKTKEKYAVKLVSERGNGFYAWNGKLYKSDIIRSSIRPEYRAVGKLKAKHIRDNGTDIKINPEAYIRFLLEEPNPYMTGQMLQEKMTIQYALNNNAFAIIMRDEFGYPDAIYPVICTSVEVIYTESKEMHLKFYLNNGKMLTWPYRDIIHIRKDYNENDVFGESPAEALTSLMEVITTTDQGIVKAIKNSNVLKWLIKIKQVLQPEDIDEIVNDFVQKYLSIDSESGGAAATDGKYDVEPIKHDSYVPNAAQMDRATRRIYDFFNTNEKIIQSKYDEDGWNAYYESVVEPLAVQLSNEFTRKLFTRKERSFGNKIIFEASSLQYASMSTKLNLMQMVDRGAMTPNEWRHVMNMGPIEGGEKPVRRLDTAVVENKVLNSINYRQLSNKNDSGKTYAVDFDGTLCENLYPKIGKPIKAVLDHVKELKDNGNKLILWTCRSGDELEAAKEWCSEHGLEFDAVNENTQENLDKFDNDSRKVFADQYIDDKALNASDVKGGDGNGES